MFPFGLNLYFTIHEIKMKEPRVKTMEPEPAPWTGSGQGRAPTPCGHFMP